MKTSSCPNLNRETTSYPNFFTFIQDPTDHHHDTTTLNKHPKIGHGNDTTLNNNPITNDSEPSETSPFKEIPSTSLSVNQMIKNHNQIVGFFPKRVQQDPKDQTIPKGPPSPNGSEASVSVGSNQFSGDSGTLLYQFKNEALAHIIPISALNLCQRQWAIVARVTVKGDIRRYNNARGDGKVFSFDLLDSDGGEIRATCFNAVLDRFYEIIEVGKVYLISKGNLKPAQKKFNHLKNEWEIILEATSTVYLCQYEDGSIPSQQFSFQPINEIEIAENNSIIDVIGIVTAVNPSGPIMRKNGMVTQRRILNLKDQSWRSVELTLWGDFCNREGQNLQEMVDSGFSPVLAVKAGKVNDFSSGKSIWTISSTQLFINVDSSEAQSLRIWFDQGGKNTTSQSISYSRKPKE
ncbi:hypothetical protein RHSIM_Rhsim05G0012200 [Rhododendron simsii]|uniref:Replication protein A subunit n=1 Tax=Rhododendron simsii TaxID=118357 RepID=A0A834LPV2_RHOSS|nr:hypothetical protein RHSIM_Rhsim05G0012200 [Rhododendron simsii]